MPKDGASSSDPFREVEVPSLATATGEATLAPASEADGARIPVDGSPARREGSPGTAASGPTSPAAVEIPAIGVRSELSQLGLDETGAKKAPSSFDTAAWFSLGPEPGQPGPAVIAGHVDSRDGPAVSYRLHELAPGDEVIVHRVDGTEIRFTVTGARSYPKTAFPTEDGRRCRATTGNTEVPVRAH